MAICKQEHENMIANLYEFKKHRMMLGIRTSCYEGINRIFNNHNLYSKYRIMLTLNKTDYLSALSDWKNVGTDMNKAIKEYESSRLGEQGD